VLSDGLFARNPRALLDLGRAAEAAGADRLVVVDHVVMGQHATEQYVWSQRPFPPADTGFLEPLTTLAALATVTSTVRLSTRILIAPLRPAALLAKTVATLDVLSGGRAELGVGVGWQREEYDAEGLDWDSRGALLTDTIAACRALWTQSPATFRSSTVTLDEIICSPQPVQDRLPVWFGGVLHDRNLDRVIRLGDGWIPIMTASLDDVRVGAKRLREAAAAAGRVPVDVQAPVPVVRNERGAADLDRTAAGVPAAVEAGATDVFFSIAELCFDPAQMAGVVESFCARIRREVGA
jgi:probable F420-dependent oxidoreductase